MAASPILHGTASKGKIDWAPGEGDKWFSALCRLEGREIEVPLPRSRRKKRTLSQNSYLHFCIHILAEHCGYDDDEMKDAVKFKFLKIHGDSSLPTVRSTSSLDTKEMGEFVDNLMRLGAELGCYLPSPGEVPRYEVDL
jgi:hypothetical protein